MFLLCGPWPERRMLSGQRTRNSYCGTRTVRLQPTLWNAFSENIADSTLFWELSACTFAVFAYCIARMPQCTHVSSARTHTAIHTAAHAALLYMQTNIQTFRNVRARPDSRKYISTHSQVHHAHVYKYFKRCTHTLAENIFVGNRWTNILFFFAKTALNDFYSYSLSQVSVCCFSHLRFEAIVALWTSCV